MNYSEVRGNVLQQLHGTCYSEDIFRKKLPVEAVSTLVCHCAKIQECFKCQVLWARLASFSVQGLISAHKFSENPNLAQ